MWFSVIDTVIDNECTSSQCSKCWGQVETSPEQDFQISDFIISHYLQKIYHKESNKNKNQKRMCSVTKEAYAIVLATDNE